MQNAGGGGGATHDTGGKDLANSSSAKSLLRRLTSCRPCRLWTPSLWSPCPCRTLTSSRRKVSAPCYSPTSLQRRENARTAHMFIPVAPTLWKFHYRDASSGEILSARKVPGTLLRPCDAVIRGA